MSNLMEVQADGPLPLQPSQSSESQLRGGKRERLLLSTLIGQESSTIIMVRERANNWSV